MSAVQIRKLNSFHERLADWLIANPGVKQSEAAIFFGYTQAWISTVIHSDAFQEYYQQLSREVSGGVTTTIRDKILGVADMAISEIGERLEGVKAKDIPLPQLLEISDTMLKRSGYGELPKGGAQVNQTFNLGDVVSKQDIIDARSAMREVKIIKRPALMTSPGGDVVEGACVEVLSSGKA